MKKLILIAVLLHFLVAQGLFAQDSSEDNVKDLLNLLNQKAELNTSIESLHASLNEMISKLGNNMELNANQQKIVEKYQSRLTEELQRDASLAVFEANTVESYLRHYTDTEIQDQLAFFKSDSGQAMIRKLPLVNKEIAEFQTQKLEAAFPKIMALIDEHLNVPVE